MKSRPTSLGQSSLVQTMTRVVAVVLLCVVAHAQSPTDKPSPTGDLLAACEKAKQSFHAVTDKEVNDAITDLRKAAKRLDRRLLADGANGVAWKKFLRWDQMQQQLDPKNTPDIKVLDAVYSRYAGGNIGLQLAVFGDVQSAIRRYVVLARARANPQLEAGYQKLIDELSEHLSKQVTEPTPEGATKIHLAMRWFEDVGQAKQLRADIRKHFGGQNLLIEVSNELIAAGIAVPVDETAPVTDCILGTSIRGTGHTTGETTTELVADKNRAIIDVLFNGTVLTDTTGRNGPVTIYSKGTTKISARKRLLVDETGISSLPTVSSATTKTTITGIRAKNDRALIEKIARKRIKKQKGQAERIAASHAEQRTNRRIDEQAAENLNKAHESFVEKFRKPLLQRNLFPQQLGFSTSSEAMNVSVLQADSTQLAAPNAPPEIIENADLALRIHESMVNNFMAGALSGMTVDNENFRDAVVDLLGTLPEKLKEDARDPWSISFTRSLPPISVSFANDEITITISGRKFRKGEDSHPGMVISVKYKIVQTEDGFKAVRQGEPQVFPPGFVPGGGESMGVRHQVIRTLLEQRFGRIFSEEFVPQGIELSGRWASAGKLKPVQLVARDGWLTVAWRAEKP